MRKFLFVVVALVSSTSVFANLLTNGSFEIQGLAVTNAAYWDTQSGGIVLASSMWGNGDRENWNSPPDGSYAYYLKGTWNGRADFGGIWQRIDGAVADQAYTLSGSFYTDNGLTAATSLFKLEFFDSGDNFLSSITTNLLGNIGNATWTPISMTATSPLNTAHIQVVFEMSGANNAGVLGGDNFDLEAIPEPPVSALLGLAGLLIAGARRFFIR